MSIILLFIQSKTFGQSDKVEVHDSTGKKELSLNGYPYIYYTPETELAFGAGGILVFYSSDDTIIQPSKVVLGGYYSTKAQYKVTLDPATPDAKLSEKWKQV